MVVVFILIWALVFVSLAIGFFGSDHTDSNDPAGDPAGKITLEQYNQIENGMSYEQVKDIIGSEGELVAEVGIKNEPFYCTIYVWEGIQSASKATFTFEDNILQSKSQYKLS